MAEDQQPKRALRERGDSPPPPGARQHEEWLQDEAVKESFPASDPPASTMPGSIAAEREAAADRTRDASPPSPSRPRSGER